MTRAGRRKTGDETPHNFGGTSESDEYRRGSSLTIPLLARYAHEVKDEPSFKKIFSNPVRWNL